MACPTCDHAMQNVGTSPVGRPLFWCGRCGTVHSEPSGRVDPSADSNLADGYYGVPKLVERCRKFIDNIGATIHIGDPLQQVVREWYADGIAESIHPPGDRPCSSRPARRASVS